jgi:hypothetical protein
LRISDLQTLKKNLPAHLCLKIKMSVYFNHYYFLGWISLSKNCKSADRKLCENGMEDSATVSRLTEFIYIAGAQPQGPQAKYFNTWPLLGGQQ